MRKIIENLNNLSLPAVILIASVILGGSYFATQVSKQTSIEKQQQIELQAKKEKESEADSVNTAINECVTDAFSELKTLQDSYGRLGIDFCIKSPSYCNQAMINAEKSKKEAQATYESEWVPQCKLGNRVFIHYEPYSP